MNMISAVSLLEHISDQNKRDTQSAITDAVSELHRISDLLELGSESFHYSGNYFAEVAKLLGKVEVSISLLKQLKSL